MEKHTVTLEGAKLKKIADNNDTAQLVLFSLADRKRFRAVTDIGHMKNILIRKGEKIVYDDYMKAWKELEMLGVGSIIYGRNGQSTRFKWNYSLTEIGKAAMNGTNVQVQELHPSKSGKRSIVTSKPAKPVEQKPVLPEAIPVRIDTQVTNVLYIPLRENFVFNAQIPKLSQKEADMICDAIKRCV